MTAAIKLILTILACAGSGVANPAPAAPAAPALYDMKFYLGREPNGYGPVKPGAKLRRGRCSGRPVGCRNLPMNHICRPPETGASWYSVVHARVEAVKTIAQTGGKPAPIKKAAFWANTYRADLTCQPPVLQRLAHLEKCEDNTGEAISVVPDPGRKLAQKKPFLPQEIHDKCMAFAHSPSFPTHYNVRNATSDKYFDLLMQQAWDVAKSEFGEAWSGLTGGQVPPRIKWVDPDTVWVKNKPYVRSSKPRKKSEYQSEIGFGISVGTYRYMATDPHLLSDCESSSVSDEAMLADDYHSLVPAPN